MSPPDGCRRLDPALDWPFFQDGQSLLGAEHAAVWPLTDDAGVRLWSGLVGDPSAVFSVRGLPRGHRLGRYSAAGPNWYTFANDPGLPDEVAGFLRRAMPWPSEQVVFYAHAPGRAYRLPWAALLRHWRLFVRQDESFVFGLGRPEFVLFADAGGLWFGGSGHAAEPAPAPNRTGGE
jgi:hypothetical protein